MLIAGIILIIVGVALITLHLIIRYIMVKKGIEEVVWDEYDGNSNYTDLYALSIIGGICLSISLFLILGHFGVVISSARS